MGALSSKKPISVWIAIIAPKFRPHLSSSLSPIFFLIKAARQPQHTVPSSLFFLASTLPSPHRRGGTLHEHQLPHGLFSSPAHGRRSPRPYLPKLPSPSPFPSLCSFSQEQASSSPAASISLLCHGIQQPGHQLLQSVSPSSLISIFHTSTTNSTNPWRPIHFRSSAPPLLGQSKQISAPLS